MNDTYLLSESITKNSINIKTWHFLSFSIIFMQHNNFYVLFIPFVRFETELNLYGATQRCICGSTLNPYLCWSKKIGHWKQSTSYRWTYSRVIDINWIILTLFIIEIRVESVESDEGTRLGWCRNQQNTMELHGSTFLFDHCHHDNWWADFIHLFSKKKL